MVGRLVGMQSRLAVALLTSGMLGLSAMHAPAWAQEQAATCFGSKATIVGTDGDDVLIGTSENDYIVGLGGNDVIDGAGGYADRVCGGDGDDELTDADGAGLDGGDGADILSLTGSATAKMIGGPGDDILRTSTSSCCAHIWPGPGDDTVDAQGPFDTLDFSGSEAAVTVDLEAQTATGEGSDTFTGIERLHGSRYGDAISGTDGPDAIKGNGGQDVMTGRGGDDEFLFGGDQISKFDGDSDLDGGAGSDWVVIVADADRHAVVDLSRGTLDTGEGNAASLQSIENVFGGDRLIGDDNPNHLYAGRFGDYIDGKKGDDVIKPGGGRDRVFAGRGNDVVTGCTGGNDRVALGEGDDMMHPGYSECGQLAGRDAIDGGPGRDTVSYETLSEGETRVIVDLRSGTICVLKCDRYPPTTIASVEVIHGSPGDDVVRGDGKANELSGGPGDDQLNGRGGLDVLDGGDGHDTCTNGESVIRCE